MLFIEKERGCIPAIDTTFKNDVVLNIIVLMSFECSNVSSFVDKISIDEYICMFSTTNDQLERKEKQLKYNKTQSETRNITRNKKRTIYKQKLSVELKMHQSKFVGNEFECCLKYFLTLFRSRVTAIY